MSAVTNEMVDAANAAFEEASNSPNMVSCERCRGKGYHHGFGEDGHDPDWCFDCSGGGYVLANGEEPRPLRAAIEAALSSLPASGEAVAEPGIRWIEWKGGDFLPVPPEMQVTVMLRDGSTEGPAKALEFAGDNSCWKHRDSSGDIVAYTSDILFAAVPEAVACPCTLIEQDETCPKGYPSLLCSVCGGKGHASQEDVSALAAEMLNIANELGEPEDPFAAWETLSLITSENERLNRLIAVYPVPDQGEVERLRKALESAVAWIITLGGNPHPDDTTADQIQIAVLASLRAAMEGK